jgi:hypothetical protein
MNLLLVDIDAASVITSLKDNMRKGERLTVAPGGSLAAIADSLGRVLLVDVHAVVVVRLWKVNLLRMPAFFIIASIHLPF